MRQLRCIEASRSTMNHTIDAFRGSKCETILTKGFDRSPMFAKGSGYSLETAGRLFRRLLSEEALKEEYYPGDAGYNITFTTLGKHANDYAEGRRKFILPVELVEKGAEKQVLPTRIPTSNKRGNPVITAAREPLTTFIPGPSKHTRPVGHTGDINSVDSHGGEDTTTEAQREETSSSILKNLVSPLSVPRSASDSNIEDNRTDIEMFNEQFSGLKQLRKSLANQFELGHPNDALREEVLQESALIHCINTLFLYLIGIN
ncbi:unnamed protein product [Rhizoctonia solani]|uniref:RQC domain-containing protein n=1 Tax=Rhizoctonia solani TaxID=456999 RepID=A0A8H3AF89_9AGAM|nr:unnamed protein product [Rhizoctonia solani]